MFSYYGSKSKIAHLYPKPKYGRIIEPFAGSARYSLLHWEHDVWLFDTSLYVVAVWKYLLAASKKDILGLPDMPSKISILDAYPSLTEPERWLIGFHLCRGKAKPRKTGHGQNSWSNDKIRIADNLHKIKHWTICHASYYEVPNVKGTWFVDPPYKALAHKGNGDRYPHYKVNYLELADYIRSRDGMVIACEGDGADYLPFELLTTTNTNTNNRTAKRNGEWVYVQEPCEEKKTNEH